MNDVDREASDDRRARREAVALEHMRAENVQDWDRVMKTFSHARYELPTGQVYDGHDDVMRYWIEGRALVPDQRNELIELTHLSDDMVQIEFWLRGTPTTTGEPFEFRLWAIFTFDAGDSMTNERVYADVPTPEQVEGLVTPDGRPAEAPG